MKKRKWLLIAIGAIALVVWNIVAAEAESFVLDNYISDTQVIYVVEGVRPGTSSLYLKKGYTVLFEEPEKKPVDGYYALDGRRIEYLTLYGVQPLFSFHLGVRVGVWRGPLEGFTGTNRVSLKLDGWHDAGYDPETQS